MTVLSEVKNTHSSFACLRALRKKSEDYEDYVSITQSN